MIHLSAAMERRLQNRQNRFPLETRVLHHASAMGELEYERAINVWATPMSGERADPLLQSVTHDVLAANHDRDFRLWSIFNGHETKKHGICVRIVELNSSSTGTWLYNYQPTDMEEDHKHAVYLLAHRGHIGFMKPSRLAPGNKRGKWRGEFNRFFDLKHAMWGN